MIGVPEIVASAQSPTGPPWWLGPIVTALLTALGSIAVSLVTVRISAGRAVELELKKQQLDVEKQRKDVSYRRRVEWYEGAIADVTAFAAITSDYLGFVASNHGARSPEPVIRDALDRITATAAVVRARWVVAPMYAPRVTCELLRVLNSSAAEALSRLANGESQQSFAGILWAGKAASGAIAGLVLDARALLGESAESYLTAIEKAAPPDPRPPAASPAIRA